MQSINDRLWNQLFYKKNVLIYNDCYKKYYSKIWGDDSLFVKFLQSKSENEQIRYSIKIVNRLLFETMFPFPNFAFKTLMHSEYLDTQKYIEDYQGQIHSVHSVMVYVLGVWLYFNHPVFNASLTDQFKNTITKPNYNQFYEFCVTKSFLSAWKIFALAHDIGYVFEGSINSEGECEKERFSELLCQFNDLERTIYCQLALRSFSNMIYVQKIASRSKTNIAKESMFFIDHNFMDHQNIQVDLRTVDFLNDESFSRVEMISTLEQFEPFLNFISLKDCIILAKDKNNHVIFINHNTTIYHVPSSGIDDYYYTDIRKYLIDKDFVTSDYTFEFYVKNIESIVESFFVQSNLPHYFGYFMEVVNDVSKKFKFAFMTAMTDSEHNNLRYSIYEYILKEVPIEMLKDNCERVEQKISQKEKENIQYCLIEIINKIVTEYTQGSPEINVAKDLYEKVLTTLNEEETRKLFIRQMMDMENDDLLELLKFVLPNVFKEMPQKSNKYIKYRNLKGSKSIVESIFSLEDNQRISVIAKEQIRYFKDYIIKYGQEIGIIKGPKELINILDYHDARHSMFDHGVVSASFIVHAYSIYKYFYKSNSQFKLIAPLVKTLNQIDANYIDSNDPSYSISIFGILLHNIYPSIYKQLYNNSYLINLDKNPFCYFSAFCDCLQRWDRPKVIDYSKTELRGDYITGREYDIEIKDKYLHIYCKTSNIYKTIIDQREKLDEYLEDASQFIKFSLYE